MSDSGFDLGLDDPARAGVFFVTADDIATLDMATRDAGLLARRIDLRGCANKPTLLLRLATGLDFPAGSGRNWDAASDRLRDLSWLPAPGYALLFEAASGLRDADESSFDTLLDVLEEAAAGHRQRAHLRVAHYLGELVNRGGDSNPYDLSRYHLKVVRLPIPPPGQVMRLAPPQHCKADQLPGAGSGSGAAAGGWV